MTSYYYLFIDKRSVICLCAKGMIGSAWLVGYCFNGGFKGSDGRMFYTLEYSLFNMEGIIVNIYEARKERLIKVNVETGLTFKAFVVILIYCVNRTI